MGFSTYVIHIRFRFILSGVLQYNIRSLLTARYVVTTPTRPDIRNLPALYLAVATDLYTVSRPFLYI
jgi:hypothetical protein